MINSKKLKGRLRELGHTQAELAAFMGLATATVSQKLNGSRPLTTDEAEKVSDFLHIPAPEFGAYFFSQDSA